MASLINSTKNLKRTNGKEILPRLWDQYYPDTQSRERYHLKGNI